MQDEVTISGDRIGRSLFQRWRPQRDRRRELKRALGLPRERESVDRDGNDFIVDSLGTPLCSDAPTDYQVLSVELVEVRGFEPCSPELVHRLP